MRSLHLVGARRELGNPKRVVVWVGGEIWLTERCGGECCCGKVVGKEEG